MTTAHPLQLVRPAPAHLASYAVVPWKRGRGYATLALRLWLPEARAETLRVGALMVQTNATFIRRADRVVE